jgi:hypothetical protein
VATPTFSPAAGTYHSAQNVTIACATSGAAIHYTIDGSTPTAASATYGGAIAVATTTTIKAMATATGQTDSAVASATYTLQAATPVISPAAGTYATTQSVTMASATPGATIHYTMDGSTPTSASPAYTAAISLPVGATAATTTIKAMATATGFADSAVASSTFVLDPAATPAEAPTFNPPAGTYNAAQAVTISTTTAGTTIHYTTDGSTPTTSSTTYSTPVQVAASLTLKAIAAGGGHTSSPVASAAYVINVPQAATPTFSPGAGTYTSAQTVTIASTTPSAVIHYTSDGSTPTAASTLYAGPVLVDASKTLKAIADAPGFTTSAVGSAAYVISTGGGSDFLTVCNGLWDKQISLMTTCLHANPDWVAATVGTSASFCDGLQKEITAGLITFNASQGAACSSAVAALTCDALSSGGGVTIPAECTAALTGTVGTGGTCYSGNDCSNGFCTWDLPTGTCPGTCQAYAALGADCTSKLCVEGQVCDSSGGTPTCKAEAGAGGACPCQSGLWCDTSGGGAGVCMLPLADGASCSTANDHCSLFSRCTGTPATCKAFVGLGATCDPGDSLCGPGYDCDAGTNKCVSWPKVGEACTSVCIGGFCDFTLTSPVCKAYLADGATCNPALFGTDCASGNCTASSKCGPSPVNQCTMP